MPVLAALNATTRARGPVSTLPAITAETVCALRRRRAGAHPGVPLTIVRDQARAQRCALVPSLAQRRGLALVCLPAYSPTLNLRERCGKCVQKPGLDAPSAADHLACQHAIIAGSAQALDKHQEALASFLTLQLPSFKAVQVIGEESNVSLFPVTQRTQRKVSSVAA